MSETTSSIKAGRSFMMVMVTNRPWPRLNVSDIHWSDRPGRGSIYGTVRVRDGALCSRKLTAADSPARGKISHVCSDLEADVGQMQMNLFEKVRVFLYLRSEFGVLREELLDVLCRLFPFGLDLGRVLALHLAAAASERGITELVADILPDNHACAEQEPLCSYRRSRRGGPA